MVVSVLLKIKFGHAQIILPDIGIPMSKTACINPCLVLFKLFWAQLGSFRVIWAHIGSYKLIMLACFGLFRLILAYLSSLSLIRVLTGLFSRLWVLLGNHTHLSWFEVFHRC